MKFPFLFKSPSTAAAWPWPACTNDPKTLSFRTSPAAGDVLKTMNSAFLDDRNTSASTLSETADSYFSIRRGESLPGSPDAAVEKLPEIDESAVFGGLRSDRLFFDPGETSSILGGSKSGGGGGGCTAHAALVAVDSRDPVSDFRASMAEMVEAQGLRDWDSLEDLLACYLRVNSRSNHEFIVDAFVDLLIHIGGGDESSSSAVDERCSSSSTATQGSFTSPLSFSSSTYSSNSPSNCLSAMENENEDEIVVPHKNVNASSSSSSSSGV
ncbi:ovate family protein 13 [Striga asiatica]|uniref:Transcription repressor n=1 Tax=Striga asiatica TaxID=4170 RepID=A0A5A7P8C2_STRAF|nr:ovate family protein 13 [Striga asiatica]